MEESLVKKEMSSLRADVMPNTGTGLCRFAQLVTEMRGAIQTLGNRSYDRDRNNGESEPI
jgi:hypothetical protein